MNTRFLRITARISLALMFCFTLPLQTAQAGMVSTTQVAAAIDPEQQRAHLIGFLERDDVAKALENHGVSATEAKARVAALTDAEIASLSQQIDQLPAGGDSVLGVLFAIFIILLITDILGLTKIFPFTRPVR